MKIATDLLPCLKDAVMELLTIEIATQEDKDLLLALLPRFNARVVIQTQSPKPKSPFIQIAEEIAAKGGITSISDPSEWQREIRSWDRFLDGREE
ncbi:hypothetical protein [Larkinella terrae]|uniref:Uncharacterized protein n=1 Tax=Larkinella terrae TaxID=2025311 RepID=A0A7K0EK73_9BACT|nr:hypothetical protein [Larkinella terrae]MRS62132.1 hypothetical protein [Larkinella terrae]